MPRSTRASLFVVSILGVATAVLAEPPSPCALIPTHSTFSGPSKNNYPFTVTIRSTREQKFVDGNAIHGMSVTHAFRDSAGRTRSEWSDACTMGEDGKLRPVITVRVQDPVAHTRVWWSQANGDGRAKIAQVQHQGVPTSMPVAAPPSPDQVKINTPAQEYSAAHYRSENLGSRTIAGVQCHGTKQVTTILAGEQGNDLPIETSSEFWIARDLGLVMLQIFDDPRVGHTVIEVTDISLSEPEASVFAPPPDYKIEERPIIPVSAP